MQAKINAKFSAVVNAQQPWSTSNGQNDSYGMLYISELMVMKHIINSNPEKLDFYFLDIGAGEFGVSNSLNTELNKLADNGSIPNNINIHLFGIRGEKVEESRVFQDNGVCKQHNLGEFFIENLTNELNIKGLGDIRFDFITSHYALGHLIDPLGVIVQAHNSLNEGGFFTFNNAPFSIDGNCHLFNQLKFLYSTNEPFLVSTRSAVELHFIMRKEIESIDGKFEYLEELQNAEVRSEDGSFTSNRDFGGLRADYHMVNDLDVKLPQKTSNVVFAGDEKLFNDVIANGIFYEYPFNLGYAGEVFQVNAEGECLA